MENKEILTIIDKKIKIYKENINVKSANETEMIAIEKLISQYIPRDDIEERIKK